MLEHTIFSEEMIASQWQFDPGIVFGHYLQTTRGGFDFHPLHQFPPLIGRPPVKNNEIIISTSLAKKLGLSSPKMVEPTLLHGTYVLFQQGQGDLNSVQCAKRFSLSVVGFVQSDQLSLYQQPEWLDGFFRFSVGLQNNELKHQQMIWMMEDNIPIKETIHKLEKNHPDYTFASPTFDIFSTIDATMEDIQLIIFSVASISIVISLLLNSLVNYLSVNDSLYQIGLLGYLGIPGVERIKLFVVSSLLQGGQSFLMASFELVVLQQIITVILHQELGYIGSQTILFQPFIVVALLSLGISLVSSFFASYRLSRLSPIQALQAR
jgi:ABC-type antimicrobial peptide transport system permease subunit